MTVGSSADGTTVDDAANFIEFEDDEEEQDEATLVLREMYERRQHCKDLIDHIRREEFGIGEELGEKEAILLQRNNERLCRSLDRLSKELYAKDTHFVLELIQNADDNTYSEDMMHDGSEEKPSVAFIVDKDSVVILNNECGFEDVNIKAICDVGKSTKGAHRKGYIGKSIFYVRYVAPPFLLGIFHLFARLLDACILYQTTKLVKQASVLRCPSYGGVRCMEVSVNGGSIVCFFSLFSLGY